MWHFPTTSFQRHCCRGRVCFCFGKGSRGGWISRAACSSVLNVNLMTSAFFCIVSRCNREEKTPLPSLMMQRRLITSRWRQTPTFSEGRERKGSFGVWAALLTDWVGKELEWFPLWDPWEPREAGSWVYLWVLAGGSTHILALGPLLECLHRAPCLWLCTRGRLCIRSSRGLAPSIIPGCRVLGTHQRQRTDFFFPLFLSFFLFFSALLFLLFVVCFFFFFPSSWVKYFKQKEVISELSPFFSF